MTKLIKTIEKYPGTLAETLGIDPEELKKYKSVVSRKGDTDYYKAFIYEYVCNNVRLDKITDKLGIEWDTVSSWASDLIPTIQMQYAKDRKAKVEAEIKAKEESGEVDNSGFDIYEYAKLYDADYYDMFTDYTYLIQEYNRAIRLGLPTPGIRIVCDGEVIGVARKMK